MKTYLRSLLYMGLFAWISIFLFNMVLGNILLTVSRAVLGDYYIIPYFLLALTVLSAILILAWRIFANRRSGEEKRLYLHSIEGQDFDLATTKKVRRRDATHIAILLAALTVSVMESVFTGLFVMFPFQFGAFWLVENIIYIKNRRCWANERLRK